MKKKNTVLLFSVFGLCILFVSRYAALFDFCGKYSFTTSCFKNLEFINNLLLFFPFILFFSLLTYKMPTEIFNKWWKFARITIPTVLLLSAVINSGYFHHPGGFFNMDNQFDLLMLLSLYGLFVLGSLVSIYRGYRKRSSNA